MTNHIYKAAVIQFAPQLGKQKETISRLQPLLKNAGGARIVVLPELANSGYTFGSRDEAFQLSEYPEKSAFVDLIQNACKKYNYAVATGFNERAGDEIFNASLLIAKEGIVGKYRKVHLFMDEKKNFSPGNLQAKVYDLDGLKVSMLICFDWIFPEIWGTIARKGAHLICHPSNLVLPGRAQQAIPVRAMENRVFIATANRTGTERGLTFTGNSIIAAPTGQVIASATAEKDEVIFADLHIAMSQDKMITPQNHLFSDRRPEFYNH